MSVSWRLLLEEEGRQRRSYFRKCGDDFPAFCLVLKEFNSLRIHTSELFWLSVSGWCSFAFFLPSLFGFGPFAFSAFLRSDSSFLSSILNKKVKSQTKMKSCLLSAPSSSFIRLTLCSGAKFDPSWLVWEVAQLSPTTITTLDGGRVVLVVNGVNQLFYLSRILKILIDLIFFVKRLLQIIIDGAWWHFSLLSNLFL